MRRSPFPVTVCLLPLVVAVTTCVPDYALADPTARDVFTAFARISLDPPRRSDAAPVAQGEVWSTRIVHTSTTAISVHVRATVPAGTPSWSLRVRDRNAALVQEIAGSARCWTVDGCWTLPVPGGQASLELVTTGPAGGLEVVADMYQYETAPSGESATIGKDDKVDMTHASQAALLLAPSVARLSVQTRGGYCTGFLLTPTLLMTNEHCIADEADALSTAVDFNYQHPRVTPEKRVAVAKLEAVDHGLDYAIVRLAGVADARYGRLRLDPAPALAAQQHLLVIQHPNGRRKMVAEIDCAVLDPSFLGEGGTLSDFRHSCDTETGSSGSPVLSLPAGQVVGLHHWGLDSNNQPFNKAVRIDLVLQNVRDVQHLSALAAEITAP